MVSKNLNIPYNTLQTNKGQLVLVTKWMENMLEYSERKCWYWKSIICVQEQEFQIRP